MRGTLLLTVDAAINLVLGLLLMIFPQPIVRWLGVPNPDPPFYARLLGAIFLGITVALVMEARRPSDSSLAGLGLGGAVVINLFGGITLAVLLMSSAVTLTLAGMVFLWGLVVVLVGISSTELVAHVSANR